MPSAVAIQSIKIASKGQPVNKAEPTKTSSKFDSELRRAKPDDSRDPAATQKSESKKKAKPSTRKAPAKKPQGAPPQRNAQAPSPQTNDHTDAPAKAVDQAAEATDQSTEEGQGEKPGTQQKNVMTVQTSSAESPLAIPPPVQTQAGDPTEPVGPKSVENRRRPPQQSQQMPLKEQSPVDGEGAEVPPEQTQDESSQADEPTRAPAHIPSRALRAIGLGESDAAPSPEAIAPASVKPQSADHDEATVLSELAAAEAMTAPPGVPQDDQPAPDSDHHQTAAVLSNLISVKPDAPLAAQHKAVAPTAQPAPPPAPDAQFVDENHPKIITGIRGELIPGGGSMHIRLDPPELGALQISVHMEDGVMTASFQTSSDDATRLLSHSLAQLKQTLESQGVSVEKLHVQQAPRNEPRQAFDDSRHRQSSENSSAQQEQQRREMLRRMWRRLTDGSDPLDMVA